MVIQEDDEMHEFKPKYAQNAILLFKYHKNY